MFEHLMNSLFYMYTVSQTPAPSAVGCAPGDHRTGASRASTRGSAAPRATARKTGGRTSEEDDRTRFVKKKESQMGRDGILMIL